MGIESFGRVAKPARSHPDSAVNRLNDLICRNVSDSRFITGVFGLLDPANRTFTFVNAGHPPPYVIRPDRPLSTLTAETECPIGVENEIDYKATVATLDAGPLTLFFYTDGIPDAENESGEFFGEPRLAAFLSSNSNRPPNDLMTRLRTTIKQFTRGQA